MKVTLVNRGLDTRGVVTVSGDRFKPLVVEARDVRHTAVAALRFGRGLPVGR